MVKTGKVLITGGAGFIGSWLCNRLIEEGHEVVCIDNLGSGNKKNVKHLLPNPRFKFIKRDIRESLEIWEKVDYIFHLASRASPADFEKYSIDILLTNAVGTRNMLELARKDNARFLLASSSEVYGDPEVHPQPEDYWGNVNSLAPRSVYDEGKRYAEAMIMAYRRRYGLDVRIARIFNTYGPRMRPDDGRVISNFVTQALRNEPITVYGDGSQTRSFCYISDMIEGLEKLMLLDGLDGAVINLGNPEEITILEAAELVKKLAKSNSEITFKPLPENDPKRRKPDISKAKRLLGWTPKVSLNEGLLGTIEYYRKVVE